jgi:glycosyltransferase involved in cell wall biosynthesis
LFAFDAEAGLVSVVLTTLNGERYLTEAVESCLQQSYRQFELIVVDGGSTDRTLEIVTSYRDERIRIVHQPENTGRLPGALNLGLSLARGEFLTWMQDDCIYSPHAIETMVATLAADATIGQVYSDYWEIAPDGRRMQMHETCPPDQILQSRSDPLGVCFLLRRSVREAIGEHSIWAYPCQDADYRWRIARRFASVHIAEPLVEWRFHPDSLSGRLGWRELARKDISIRQRLGMTSRFAAWLELGETDIAYAFDRYEKGQLNLVPRLVLSGVARNPLHAGNRGVWSILVRSFLGARAGA